MKKVVSVLMSFVMLLSVFSGFTLSANASDTVKGKCGDIAYYEYNSSTGEFTISGKGVMWAYGWDQENEIEIKQPWNSYLKNIKKVVVKTGITSVGWSAFENSGVKEIVLPNGIEFIDGNAFNNCNSLTTVYYNGTRSQWKKVKVYENNESLLNANIKFENDSASGGNEGNSGGGTVPTPAPSTPEDTNKEPETKPSETTPAPSTSKKPATVTISKPQPKTKSFVVRWKVLGGVYGYQIQVATNKKFKKNKKTITVKKANASKKTVKKLKAKKKYFVRVRAFKVVDGKKSYGKWSKVKSVKTK